MATSTQAKLDEVKVELRHVNSRLSFIGSYMKINKMYSIDVESIESLTVLKNGLKSSKIDFTFVDAFIDKKQKNGIEGGISIISLQKEQSLRKADLEEQVQVLEKEIESIKKNAEISFYINEK